MDMFILRCLALIWMVSTVAIDFSGCTEAPGKAGSVYFGVNPGEIVEKI